MTPNTNFECIKNDFLLSNTKLVFFTEFNLAMTFCVIILSAIAYNINWILLFSQNICIPPTGVGAGVAAAAVLPRALVEVPAGVVVGRQLVAWAQSELTWRRAQPDYLKVKYTVYIQYIQCTKQSSPGRQAQW